jgi:hypothetical protein
VDERRFAGRRIGDEDAAALAGGERAEWGHGAAFREGYFWIMARANGAGPV